MEILLVIAKVVGMMLTADLLTGVFHFWMDQYGREDMPIVGKSVIEINILHHRDPRNMVKKSYLQLTWTAWVLGIVLGLGAYLLEFLSWEVIFVLAYGANANIIHKWTHQTHRENGAVIAFFQKIRLLQSKKHHGWHHKAPYDTNYCILTDWLNPILHRIRFWEGIVFILKRIGIYPVAGTQIREFV
jgi:plasmanylethanolamine desaturase